MFSTNQTFTNYYDCCNASSLGICNTLGKPYGSLYISGKLPTYPASKPTLTLTSHLGQNVALGEELVGIFPEKYNDPVLCEGN